MNVVVRYHAAARELAGSAEESIELTNEMTAAELLAILGARHIRLARHIGKMRIAKNGDLGPLSTLIVDGDEIDVLPPVAGGSAVCLVAIRETPLSIDECVRAVSHPSAGGIATFVGVVRDHADGAAVARLDYEHHPTIAEKEMRRVLETVVADVEGARVAATHRIGQLAVGDLAVVVAASAPHRAEAFAACRFAIDRIKDTVPIWKKEWAPDGAAHWVNLDED